jgi:hypothetical protein
LMWLAAILEKNSEHPLAKAVVEYAQQYINISKGICKKYCGFIRPFVLRNMMNVPSVRWQHD